MSFVSGKSDLLNHIMGQAGWYDSDGNPIKFGEGHGAYYSDIYRDFIEFKKRTGGILHQNKRIKEVNQLNHELIAKKNPQFKVIRHENKVTDKRKKSGYRIDVSYTYEYWGKEHTAKELKKNGGVFITIDIKFETLLDLIPYFPYIVTACSCSDGKEVVFISSKPYPEEELEEGLEYGTERDTYSYRSKLSEFYKECVLRYFNPEGRESIEQVTFDENGVGQVSEPIDENFKIKWHWAHKPKDHWTSPKIIDAKNGLIQMHEYDLKLLGNKMFVYYVKYKEPKLWLG